MRYFKLLGLSFGLVLTGLTLQAQTGVGTTTPTSSLQVIGSMAGNYATITATTYTLGIADHYVAFGAGATAASTFSLPAAATATGRFYYLKNDNATFALTVSPNGSETINGSATVTIPTGQSVQLVSTGAASGATWEVVAFNNSTATPTPTVTASNGLTKTGSVIGLGGTLTGATTIAQGGNAFSLTGGNVGISTTTPGAKLEVNSGTTNTSGVRLTNLTTTAPTATILTSLLGVNSTGDVVIANSNNVKQSAGAFYAQGPMGGVDTSPGQLYIPPTAATYDELGEYSGGILTASQAGIWSLSASTQVRVDGSQGAYEQFVQVLPNGGSGWTTISDCRIMATVNTLHIGTNFVYHLNTGDKVRVMYQGAQGVGPTVYAVYSPTFSGQRAH